MSKIKWDQTGEKLYQTGIDQVVVYPYDTTAKGYGKGVGWNGVTSVAESPSGAEPTKLYADNSEYLTMRSQETFGGSINAYTCPDEVEILDGTREIAKGVRIHQQTRGTFAMTYRSLIGDDVEGTDRGYTIHLVYGASISPSEQTHSSVNESPEAEELSWTFDTVAVDVPKMKKTSHIEISSLDADSAKLKALEDILYGTDADAEAGVSGTDPRIPMPEELIGLMTPANG